MSADQIELVQRGFDAFDRDDIDGWLATLDPAVELRTTGLFPDVDRVYQGHHGARRFWDDMREPWKNLHVASKRLEQHGEFVALGLEFHAVGARSDAKIDLEYATAYRFEGELVKLAAAHRSFDEALATITTWQTEASLRQA
jgi:ketosteroid isomerase-like protein